ncbi:MAG: nucleotidyltransferase domain-containing protein [Bacteroidales bacterium]|nr:nucleotidyltransferase domain-containing protein [Bacteroidales bacterium]
MNKLIKNKIKDIIALCEKLNVEKLWIFGSVVSDHFSSQSDIDFLVSFQQLEIEDYAENYFLLAENLEQIFNREIDLVTVKSLSNPYFVEEVETNKQLVYDRQNQKILV